MSDTDRNKAVVASRKILEHRDVLQIIPGDAANSNGMSS